MKKRSSYYNFISEIEDTDKILGLNVGADDYMTKPFNPLELMARVKSQLRRYTQLGAVAEKRENIYQTGGLMIDDDRKEVSVDGEVVKLTPIEYRILLFLVRNQGRVFSINQIYESIWEEEAIAADNTVAVHIRHIREKKLRSIERTTLSQGLCGDLGIKWKRFKIPQKSVENMEKEMG